MSTHGPSISHIFFADDTLIFLKANKVNCHNLGRLFKTCCSTSGQAVNLQKLCVFFSANAPMEVAEELGIVLGILVVFDPRTYSGVPTIWGCSKCRGLTYVKGLMMGKVQGWKQCTLSQDGKEVMIKVVA